VSVYTSVEQYLSAQPADRLAEVETLRAVVMDAAPGITEIIKWNSPSYVWQGEDRLTINVGRGPARLVLHRGVAQAENKSAAPTFAGDPAGVLTWHSDIRASMAAEVEHDVAVAVVREWLAS